VSLNKGSLNKGAEDTGNIPYLPIGFKIQGSQLMTDQGSTYIEEGYDAYVDIDNSQLKLGVETFIIPNE